MKRFISLLTIIVLIISQCACGVQPTQSGPAISTESFGEDWLLNTYCYIKIFEPGKEDLIKEAFAYSRSLENLLSRTIDSSSVAKVNSAKAHTGYNVLEDTSFADFESVFRMATYMSEACNYAFDVSIGAVSRLWDFTSGEGKLPKDSDINEGLKYVGEGKIWIAENGDIEKSDDQVMVDFGAIAKGYIANAAGNMLRNQGIKKAILSFGGNIILIGEKSETENWNVGIQSPVGEGAIGSVSVSPSKVDKKALIDNFPPMMSIVTSGTYERYIEDKGTIYHHILDPKTGYSVETDLDSASIIGQDSIKCDALATICILLGSDAAVQFMDSYNKTEDVPCEYLLIKNDGTFIPSSGANFSN